MEFKLKSFLLSTIVVDNENIYYKDSNKEGSIKIADITYLNYEEAKLFKSGYLLIKENRKEHRIPFDETKNSKIKEFCSNLSIVNKVKDEVKPFSFEESLNYYYSNNNTGKKQKKKKKLSITEQEKTEDTISSKEVTDEIPVEEASEMKMEEAIEPTANEKDELSKTVLKNENQEMELEKVENNDELKDPEQAVSENTVIDKPKEKKKTFGESFKGFVNNMEEFSMKVPQMFTLKYLGGHPLITSDGDAYLTIKNGKITLRKGLKQVTIDNIKSARFETEEEIKRRYTATRIALLGVFALAFKKQKKIQNKFLIIEFVYEGMDSVIMLTGKDAQKAHGTLVEVVSYYKKKEMEAKEKKLKEQKAVAPTKTIAPKLASVKASSSKADELMKLKGLVEEGYLTKEEFLEAKKETEAKAKELKEKKAASHRNATSPKTVPPKAASVKPTSSKADELIKLKGLVEEGYLTKEEFLEAKKEILDAK